MTLIYYNAIKAVVLNNINISPTSCNHLLFCIDVLFPLTRRTLAMAGCVLSNVPNMHALFGAADHTINSLFWECRFTGQIAGV